MVRFLGPGPRRTRDERVRRPTPESPEYLPQVTGDPPSYRRGTQWRVEVKGVRETEITRSLWRRTCEVSRIPQGTGGWFRVQTVDQNYWPLSSLRSRKVSTDVSSTVDEVLAVTLSSRWRRRTSRSGSEYPVRRPPFGRSRRWRGNVVREGTGRINLKNLKGIKHSTRGY